MTEAERITLAHGGDWYGNYGKIPGPGHSSRDRSLKVWDSDDGVKVHSFAGDDWRDCRRHLDLEQTRTHDRPHRHRPKAKRQEQQLRWSDRAEHLWQSGMPLRGTIGEVYLLSRGCRCPDARDLRCLPEAYHWVSKTRWPAMLGRITDFVTGAPLSLHLTFLAVDGSGKAPIVPPRLYLAKHQKQGGVIRLVPDEDVELGLALAEGLENSLSTMAGGWRPCWAAIDAGNMGRLPVVPGIESLTIFPDPEKTGRDAADDLADRWREAGREARIVPPPDAC